MEINPLDGTNLGYMFLNCIEKREEKKIVAERIHQIREEIAERLRKESTKEVK